MRKLIVAVAAAAMLAGGAGAANADPFGRGPGPGPGNSGDRAMYGLCKAYANNSDQAKKNSAVFSEYTADEWEELCEGVTPGGSRNEGAGRP